MNRIQLSVMWFVGLGITWIFYDKGAKLLTHAAENPETIETGYPFTLLAGTVWAQVFPLLILGVLLMVTFKGKKRGKK